jgi:tetratricopeptide (TPR) repeat protein
MAGKTVSRIAQDKKETRLDMKCRHKMNLPSRGEEISVMSRTHHFLGCLLVLAVLGREFPAGGAIREDGLEQAKVLAEGKKHLAEERFAEAITTLNRLKQLAPSDPQAYFFSGIAFAESGHLNAAAAELYEAVRLGSGQPEHALALANVLTRLGQKREATTVLAVFNQKTALDRLSTVNLGELMKVYFSLEMTSEALSAVDELARREPNNPRIDFYRGKIYRLIGSLDLAQQAIEKSLRRAPVNPADQFELGKIYEQRGQMVAARGALLEALKQKENDPEYLYAMASVCLSLNEIDEAIEYLKRAEPAAASLPKIYYALGQAYQRERNSEKATLYFRLQKDQESRLVQHQKELREREELMLMALAREKIEQRSAAEARALLQQLVELNPNSSEAHQHLVEIYLASGDWPQAHAHLDPAPDY